MQIPQSFNTHKENISVESNTFVDLYFIIFYNTVYPIELNLIIPFLYKYIYVDLRRIFN